MLDLVMASRQQIQNDDNTIKRIAVRMPKSFWRQVRVVAAGQDLSINTAATLGLAMYLGIAPPDLTNVTSFQRSEN